MSTKNKIRGGWLIGINVLTIALFVNMVGLYLTLTDRTLLTDSVFFIYVICCLIIALKLLLNGFALFNKRD